MTAKLAPILFLLAIATPALAGEAEDVSAVLSRHLNAHGRHFVGAEAKRLAIGDASESGARDDVRDACPHSISCFDTFKMSPDEVMAALLVLSAQRAQSQLEQQLAKLTGRNEELKRLVTQLQNEPDKNRQAELKSQIEKLNGDSQIDMIRLQDLMNKRNQAHDMMTDTIQKFQKTLDGIIRDMR